MGITCLGVIASGAGIRAKKGDKVTIYFAFHRKGDAGEASSRIIARDYIMCRLGDNEIEEVHEGTIITRQVGDRTNWLVNGVDAERLWEMWRTSREIREVPESKDLILKVSIRAIER